MATFALLLLLAAAAPLLPPAAAQRPPGCRRRCGNVTVPYPFGIGARCHRGEDRGFRLECDDTRRPPRLTVAGYGHEVVAISLASAEATVLLNASRACYDRASGSGRVLGRREYPMALNGSAFLFSSMKSKFVAIGCPDMAYFVDDGGDYVTGCMSVCRPSERALPGSCRGGDGCCQSNIPLGLDSYRPYIRSFGRRQQQQTFLANSTGCAYAFMVDAWWFWYAGSHFNRTGDFAVPVVLDWAIRGAGGSCAAARENATAYACRSAHSVCLDSTNGPGYVCNCTAGYEGNPYVLGGCNDVDECAQPQKYGCYGECTNLPGMYYCRCPRGTHGNHTVPGGCIKPNTGVTIGIGVGSGAGAICLILASFIFTQKLKHHRKQMMKQKFFERNRGRLLQQLVSQRADIAERMIISLEELEKATNNFDKTRELGGGGHGTVYKGILSDLHVVAIKKPKMVIQKEIDEFINEVAILSQINHRNVVKLYGCCLETEVPMLVYEFISNGTLYDHLHISEQKSLSWDDRLRIATETAKSLAYLHMTVSIPIIHRDIKSANILLDDTLVAKVADFGASRYVPVDKNGVTTIVQGTRGYLDPMYLSTGRLTDKSDVYSFGVMLLEVLTRKKPFSYLSSEGDGLVEHFTTLFAEGTLSRILDPQIVDEGGKEVEEVAKLALACLKLTAENRPTMRDVEFTLEGLQGSKRNILDNMLVETLEEGGTTMTDPTTTSLPNIKESSRQYSMEEEILLSSRYPR